MCSFEAESTQVSDSYLQAAKHHISTTSLLLASSIKKRKRKKKERKIKYWKKNITSWTSVMPYLDPTIDAHILCNGQPWEVGAELCPSLVPTIDAHILCNGQLCAAGAEICPLMVISAEVPISWTTLSDSESRLSRFIRAITSFRCNCSWRSNRLQFSLWEKKTGGMLGD